MAKVRESRAREERRIGGVSGPPALGIWEGDKLTFQSQSEMGHGRYTYTFLADGRLNFKLENSMDSKNWTLFMEGNYRKK